MNSLIMISYDAPKSHIVSNNSRMEHKSVPEFGILDHVFIGGGLEWHVFVRITPNEDGSTVT